MPITNGYWQCNSSRINFCKVWRNCLLRNAILTNRVREQSAPVGELFLFLLTTMPRETSDAATDLSSLRRKITQLVAKNAVPMVQQAIDAVKEEGQYQAIKYLFEMIGLYPATAQDESQAQESLARTLLDHLG